VYTLFFLGGGMMMEGVLMEKVFFDKIKQFFTLQDQQRQRGLNNYNLLTAVLSPSDEVRLHSRMLYSLLNPNGKHFQGSLFLESFLKMLEFDDFEMNLDNCIVKKEYENIDLYISDGNRHIIIENKIYAGDQEAQIERYIEIIKKENPKAEGLAVVYLSLDREEPTEYSLGTLKVNGKMLVDDHGHGHAISHFRSIHYKKEIMAWLEQCRHEVQNITNLNHAIEQYMDVVRMINNEYKGKAMSLTDYLKDNKELYQMALAVSKAMPKVRELMAEEFFMSVITELKQKLGEGWVVENTGDLSSTYSFPLKIYKSNWDKKNSLIIGFEFQCKDFHKCYLGIVRRNKNICIKGGIDNTFKTELGKLDKNLKMKPWWLHWECFHKGDFIEYLAQSELKAKDELVNKLYELAEIFEINSGLLSKINKNLAA